MEHESLGSFPFISSGKYIKKKPSCCMTRLSEFARGLHGISSPARRDVDAQTSPIVAFFTLITLFVTQALHIRFHSQPQIRRETENTGILWMSFNLEQMPHEQTATNGEVIALKGAGRWPGLLFVGILSCYRCRRRATPLTVPS